MIDKHDRLNLLQMMMYWKILPEAEVLPVFEFSRRFFYFY